MRYEGRLPKQLACSPSEWIDAKDAEEREREIAEAERRSRDRAYREAYNAPNPVPEPRPVPASGDEFGSWDWPTTDLDELL